MAIEAVNQGIQELPYAIDEIDLIVGATYTPYDTVATIAHAVQSEFKIKNAKCFCVDSACSSFINAIEIVECFFANKKATKALIIISECNSKYCDHNDKKSNFLWGDGATAVFISKSTFTRNDLEVIDIETIGLGHIGKSIEAISLRPDQGGLRMPFGKDVFQFACIYMLEVSEKILNKNNIIVDKLRFFIPHQANLRIIDYVSDKLKIDPAKVLHNIEDIGNTGSASTPILLSQNMNKFNQNDIILITVFGGGYSAGTMLLKKI
ncbi:MAG: 3-oxoacyl-[acyl-carrier-protein] synthase III C-terminal domain-containing protein [Paludibacter sp.]|nr:3-oxoacyl-[acyl-carrier-protein] synthase III C-terminal domain-containing protein [Paludibacter sp.]